MDAGCNAKTETKVSVSFQNATDGIKKTATVFATKFPAGRSYSEDRNESFCHVKNRQDVGIQFKKFEPAWMRAAKRRQKRKFLSVFKTPRRAF